MRVWCAGLWISVICGSALYGGRVHDMHEHELPKSTKCPQPKDSLKGRDCIESVRSIALNDLPDDALLAVFAYLDVFDLQAVRATSRRLKELSESVWRTGRLSTTQILRAPHAWRWHNLTLGLSESRAFSDRQLFKLQSVLAGLRVKRGGILKLEHCPVKLCASLLAVQQNNPGIYFSFEGSAFQLDAFAVVEPVVKELVLHVPLRVPRVSNK